MMTKELRRQMIALESVGFNGILSIYASECSERELFLASPFRTSNLRQRLEGKLHFNLSMLKDSYIEAHSSTLHNKAHSNSLNKDNKEVEVQEEGCSDNNSTLDKEWPTSMIVHLQFPRSCLLIADHANIAKRLARRSNEGYMNSLMSDLAKLDSLISGYCTPDGKKRDSDQLSIGSFFMSINKKDSAHKNLPKGLATDDNSCLNSVESNNTPVSLPYHQVKHSKFSKARMISADLSSSSRSAEMSKEEDPVISPQGDIMIAGKDRLHFKVSVFADTSKAIDKKVLDKSSRDSSLEHITQTKSCQQTANLNRLGVTPKTHYGSGSRTLDQLLGDGKHDKHPPKIGNEYKSEEEEEKPWRPGACVVGNERVEETTSDKGSSQLKLEVLQIKPKQIEGFASTQHESHGSISDITDNNKRISSLERLKRIKDKQSDEDIHKQSSKHQEAPIKPDELEVPRDSECKGIPKLELNPLRLRGLAHKKHCAQPSLIERRRCTALKIETKKDLKKQADIDQLRFEYDFYKATRPMTWQMNALTSAISSRESLKKSHFRITLLDVSCPKLLNDLAEFNLHKEESKRIDAIVLSPHLHFYSESLGKGDTKFKFGHPIREKCQRNLLIEHVKQGNISAIASGHLFAAREVKHVDRGCFIRSVHGWCSAGYQLHILWTQLVLGEAEKKSSKEFDFSREQIKGLFQHPYSVIAGLADVVSRRPAEIMKLESKGRLAVGFDGDFSVFDPFQVCKVKISYNIKDCHLLDHHRLIGKTEATFVRGRCTYRAESQKENVRLASGSVGTVLWRNSKGYEGDHKKDESFICI